MINNNYNSIVKIVLLLEVIVLLSLFCGCLKRIDKPVNKYGEFPFKLVYEINGERIEIDDTLVIEYLGQDWNEGSGTYNVWNTYHKNGTKDKNCTRIELYSSDEEDGVTVTCFLGSCEYYMGIKETESSIYEIYK